MYASLSDNDLTTLRRERLAGLEADHFRLVLRLEENGPDAPQLAEALAELERRIGVHRAALEPGQALPDGEQGNGQPVGGDVGHSAP